MKFRVETTAFLTRYLETFSFLLPSNRSGMIDEKIEGIITECSISQIIEFGAGMSERGSRFSKKYPAITYIESDLPDMVLKKIRKINGKKTENHFVFPFDVINGDYRAIKYFNKNSGGGKTIFVAEGLMLYTGKKTRYVLGQIREVLSFAGGGYLVFDAMHEEDEKLRFVKFLRLLAPLFKENPQPNFRDGEEGKRALEILGFSSVDFEKQWINNIYVAAC